MGLDFGVEQVPDATTLLHSRHLLEKHELGKALFESQNQIFDEQDWIMRGGSIVDAVNLAGVKRSHAILPVLRDADEQRVTQACASVAATARDAAITLLALTTCLRGCDIIGLRLSNIDWRGQTIGIVQQMGMALSGSRSHRLWTPSG